MYIRLKHYFTFNKCWRPLPLNWPAPVVVSWEYLVITMTSNIWIHRDSKCVFRTFSKHESIQNMYKALICKLSHVTYISISAVFCSRSLHLSVRFTSNIVQYTYDTNICSIHIYIYNTTICLINFPGTSFHSCHTVDYFHLLTCEH